MTEPAGPAGPTPTEPTGPAAPAPGRPPTRTRVSFLRLGVVLVVAAAVAVVGFRGVTGVVQSTIKPEASAFSAYVDVTVTPTYPFETPAGPAQASVILSFVVADPGDACTPMWGGAYTLDSAASDLELDRRISQLRRTGGDARVSFGGQAGTELASACTDADALAKAYSAVVDRYDLTGIDLDLEGASLTDTAATARRATAIKQVQDDATAAGRHLSVWLTLPVAPSGLTADGTAVVDAMLAAGVDVAGVNGMTMDFGTATSAAHPMSDLVLEAAAALQGQVKSAFSDAGVRLNDSQAWSRVGLTPMIGQNDIATEQFTIHDAIVVNTFARDHGVGQLSMWSLNRDGTCTSPLPSVLTVVQTSCSGVDQNGNLFAELLAEDLPLVVPSAGTSQAPSPSVSATADVPVSTDATDDPATSPFPIWDPLGTYPGGTKIVWHREVYQAKWWTSGVAPDTRFATAGDSPWTLIGPVLPGDTPAPLPTLPAGSYPQWDPTQAYVAGTRVQVDLVPYEAKWWTQGQQPGVAVAGGSPWVLVNPGG